MFAMVERLGLRAIVEEAAVPCSGVQRLWYRTKPPGAFETEIADSYLVDRTAFDRSLRREAVAAGVRYIPRRLRSFNRDGDRWQLEGTGCRSEAGFIVDATGRASRLVRRLGVLKASARVTLAHGASFPIAARSPYLRVERVKKGWWYWIDNETTSFAVLVAEPPALPRRDLEHWASLLGESPWAEATREQISRVASLSSLDATARLRTAAGDRWLSIGDACASFDPIASQGLAHSLSSAYFASCALVDHMANPQGAALRAYDDAVALTWHRTVAQQNEVFAGSL